MFNHEDLRVFFRGEFVDFKNANISIANSGFLYGLGVFTGIRANYNKAENTVYLFRPDLHFKRFLNGCKLLHYTGFTESYDYNKFLDVLCQLFRLNNIREDAYIRVTNFTDENRITPKMVHYKDSLCAFLYPLGDYLPPNGLRCTVSSWIRTEDNAIPSRAKINGAYVNSAFAKTQALRHGFDEAIFLNADGHVVEGSAENIFVIQDEKLITPPAYEAILEGITRQSVIDIARNEGLEVIERSIDRSELYRADEILLTGTAAKVSPVVEIDSYKIGTGEVGPICRRIQKIYEPASRGELPQYKTWLHSVY